ncbi:MAG: hypothetical protein JJ855_08470 [Rhodospirillales bacterium]|nr:hypothetical protein [Rhodospirillales bacterium]
MPFMPKSIPSRLTSLSYRCCGFGVLVLVMMTLTSPANADLPSGRIDASDVPLMTAQNFAEISGDGSAVEVSRVTMQYRFDVLMGEPTLVFHGNYSIGEISWIKTTPECWSLVSKIGDLGIHPMSGSSVQVWNVGRFQPAFKEVKLLSSSQFSLGIEPLEKIMVNGKRFPTNGLHVRFRPDTLLRAFDEYGPAVKGSPDWGKAIRDSSGAFIDADAAKKIFRIGFEVGELRILEANFNVNALKNAVRDVCADLKKRMEEEAKKSAKKPAIDTGGLDDALASAFDPSSEDGGKADSGPSPAIGSQGVSNVLEDAFNVADAAREDRAKRKRVAQLKQTSQQFLGVQETVETEIKILAWDHGTIDGDRVSILHNGHEVDVLTLSGDPEPITIDLQRGDNVIEIKARNQGGTGKNTASFVVQTIDGKELARKKWSLTTGGNAKLLLIRI